MLKHTKLALAIFALSLLIIFSFWNFNLDLSAKAQNSLSTETKELLSSLHEPLVITSYSQDTEFNTKLNRLAMQYKAELPNLRFEISRLLKDELHMPNPKITDSNISVLYDGKVEHSKFSTAEINEQHLSALINRAINKQQHWLAFSSGHDEANIYASDDLGLSNFNQDLQTQGFKTITLDLAKEQMIPKNVSLLIIANPSTDFLNLEKSLITNYIKQGGKVLWLAEPASATSALIQELFGIKVGKLALEDPKSTRLGSPHPAIKIMQDHPNHPINAELRTYNILPWSAELNIDNLADQWQAQSFLALNNKTIGLSLESTIASAQRIAIIADGGFMLNKYYRNPGNAKVLAATINWLLAQNIIFTNQSTIADLSYKVSEYQFYFYATLLTIILPLLFLAIPRVKMLAGR